MDHSNHDWAYLEKFRLANEKLKVYSDENRIVFIGDSIIAGWNDSSIFAENPNYVNRGINGQTTAQILHRFQNDVIDLKPKQVVILVGTNDIAENNGFISIKEIQNNFLSIIGIAKSNAITVILCSVLPTAQYYWNKKIQPFDKIKELNIFLASLSDNKTVFYIDFHTSFVEDEHIKINYSDDGVHPNKLGYQQMSKLLIHDLKEIKKKQ